MKFDHESHLTHEFSTEIDIHPPQNSELKKLQSLCD